MSGGGVVVCYGEMSRNAMKESGMWGMDAVLENSAGVMGKATEEARRPLASLAARAFGA